MYIEKKRWLVPHEQADSVIVLELYLRAQI